MFWEWLFMAWLYACATMAAGYYFGEKSGYKRGRSDGYQAGFEAGSDTKQFQERHG